LFNSIRSWIGNLSGPKKVATAVVAIAAGVTAVIGAITGPMDLQERLAARSEAANPLELVDVAFTPVEQQANNGPGKGVVPALDFRVQNNGDNPVVIKRADLRVKKIWTLKPPYTLKPGCAGGALLPSYNYDAKLTPNGAPYTVTVPVIFQVKPSEADRFTISLKVDERKASSGEDYVFLIAASLVYGSDDKVVSNQDVLYGKLHHDQNSYSYRKWNECWGPRNGSGEPGVAELTKQNQQAITDIRDIEAPSNKALEVLLQSASPNSTSSATATASATAHP
jgi:hypothetical protein